MPKKQKTKRDEFVTDAGLVLDAEQAAEVRKQIYEGSYSVRAPEIEMTDDDIIVRVGATVYTIYGDSPLTTTTVLRRSEQSYTPAALGGDDVGYAVRDALDRARDAALATIESVNAEWEANVGEPDDTESDDADEGLREGPVVGSGPLSGFDSRVDIEAVPSLAELKRRKAFAEAVIAECKAAKASGNDEDWIRVPNGEYADLVAAARREAAFRDVFASGFPTMHSSQSGSGRPFLRIAFPSTRDVRRADDVLENLLDSTRSGGPFERPVSDDGGAATAGEVDIPTFVAATTAIETASDASDASQDDGGSVEPELDIDALVAAADLQRDTSTLDICAVRSSKYPALTVTVTGPGSADFVRQIISDIHLPSLTDPLVGARPAEDDVGEFSKTVVDPVADAEAICRSVRARF